MDRITSQQRSYVMSRIKGKNTTPEIIMFECLDKVGWKYEKHSKLLGNPDVVFPDDKVVLFIDGDFWHGWNFKSRKDSLPSYWVAKIKRNMSRDRQYRKALKDGGWVVLRLWEHQILKNPSKALAKVMKVIPKVSLKNY